MSQKIPKSLQAILWSADINHLNINRDREYIIHQILMCGSFPELGWLFKTYTKKEIIDVFLNVPFKIYPKKVFYFVKNFLLCLKYKKIDEQNYITSIFGKIRPRTAKGF